MTIRQTDKSWFNGYLHKKNKEFTLKLKKKTQTLDGHNFVNLETTTFNDIERIKTEFEESKQTVLIKEGSTNP